MAYENVNVQAAKNALNQCMNSISYNTSSKILSDLRGNSYWECNCKSTYLTAVDTLVNTRYKRLKEYIKHYLNQLDKIQKYKDLQSENAKIESIIVGKQNELNTQKNKYNKLDDKTTTEAKNIKDKISRLEKEISNYKSKKAKNSETMSSIAKSIDLT